MEDKSKHYIRRSNAMDPLAIISKNTVEKVVCVA